MPVVSEVSEDGKKLTISITGRFDFAKHQAFRQSYEGLVPAPKSIEVDLKDAIYLDSSALGMLLLLRDHAGGEHADVALCNANADVGQILRIANFEKIFKVV